ncbi:uncharacterized protein [Venturia canescens]|uniref:uncharacterized protein isoform X2 n=1 Tax=Venturia canescens TaxID=32260 RepID=UPI001C9CC630|nr:uncharacterized protein LOC122415390 isoform X2 [Venturia canescens]
MQLRYEDYVSPSDPWIKPDIWVEVTDGERRVYLIYDDITPELQAAPKINVWSYRRAANDVEAHQNAVRSRALWKRRNTKKEIFSGKRKSESPSWADVVFKKRRVIQEIEKQKKEEEEINKWKLIPIDFDSPRPPNVQKLSVSLKRVVLSENEEEEIKDPRKKKKRN